MAVTDLVKRSIEGTLFYNLDYDADESITSGWIEVGYVTDLSFTENPNPFKYYKKFEKQPNKRGIPENTGTLTQWFTNYNASLLKIAKQGLTVALRVDIADNDEGPATEQFFVDVVDFEQRDYNVGDTNTGNDAQSITLQFSYNDSHFYQPT